VVVSGNGYSLADVRCTISTGNPTLDSELFGSTSQCSMSVGNAGASYVVQSAAPAGLYVITVTGQTCSPSPCGNYGTSDFASTYFEVPSITTTATTISVSSSTISTGTTTVTLNKTSTSVSTTTVSSTGATTESSFALTTQTYYAGPATSTTTTTTSTTLTATLPFTILTTTTLFTTSVIGGIITAVRNSPSSDLADLVGVMSVLGLLGPILLRRFLT